MKFTIFWIENFLFRGIARNCRNRLREKNSWGIVFGAIAQCCCCFLLSCCFKFCACFQESTCAIAILPLGQNISKEWFLAGLREVCVIIAKNRFWGINCVIISERRVRSQTSSSVSFFGPHRVPGRELSELLSAYDLCARSSSQSFSQTSPKRAQKLSECSLPKQNLGDKIQGPSRGQQKTRKPHFFLSICWFSCCFAVGNTVPSSNFLHWYCSCFCDLWLRCGIADVNDGVCVCDGILSTSG